MRKNTPFVFILCLLPLTAYADTLVDPTRPASYRAQNTVQQQYATPQTQREWILNTTIISPTQRLAIINGKRLSLGDDINGATLLEIGHQKVKLRYEGKVVTLALHNSFISKVKPITH
jgi:hypothetical protein